MNSAPRPPRSLASGWSRRDILRFGAAGAAGAVLMPAASWGRILGANERIRMGIIGTGGMGTVHLRNLAERGASENLMVTRVCDVYRRRLNTAAGIVEKAGWNEAGSKTGTMEYREVLDDKSIDAVLIATPDHWHTKMAIEAMEAGKAVYVEKPLSLTVEQAIACREAVKRTGKVLQVGPQGTSEDRWWKAREAIGAGSGGRIGKVVWSQASYNRNSRGGQFNWTIDPDAGPKAAESSDGYVWWDRWLGHEWGLAENIPWNADHFFRFRKYFAYNGGLATDLLYHRLAPLLLAITGPNGEYPAKVTASGGRFLEKDERDIPDTFMMMVEYPSEHLVVLASVMTNDEQWPDVIRGQHGSIHLEGAKLEFREQGTWSKEFREKNGDKVTTKTVKNDKGKDVADPPEGEAKFTIEGGERRDHMGNFLDAVRGIDKPHCNIDLGCSTMVAIKMGVEAYRRGKVMKWDAAKEQMIEG